MKNLKDLITLRDQLEQAAQKLCKQPTQKDNVITLCSHIEAFDVVIAELSTQKYTHNSDNTITYRKLSHFVNSRFQDDLSYITATQDLYTVISELKYAGINKYLVLCFFDANNETTHEIKALLDLADNVEKTDRKMTKLKLKNYTVYLDDAKQITLAKCNVTGKFVKLAYARIEYARFIGYNAVAQIKRAEYIVDNKTSSIEKLATNTVLALYYALSAFFVVNFLVN